MNSTAETDAEQQGTQPGEKRGFERVNFFKDAHMKGKLLAGIRPNVRITMSQMFGFFLLATR